MSANNVNGRVDLPKWMEWTEFSEDEVQAIFASIGADQPTLEQTNALQKAAENYVVLSKADALFWPKRKEINAAVKDALSTARLLGAALENPVLPAVDGVDQLCGSINSSSTAEFIESLSKLSSGLGTRGSEPKPYRSYLISDLAELYEQFTSKRPSFWENKDYKQQSNFCYFVDKVLECIGSPELEGAHNGVRKYIKDVNTFRAKK